MLARKVVIYGKEDVRIVSEKIDPEKIGDNEILFETEISFISAGTELSRVFALKKGATYPVYPGYCSVGRVLKTGRNVSNLKEGDRIVCSAPHASLSMFDPAKSDGGVVFKISDETSSKEAVFMTMERIALNAILPVDVKFNDKVIVMGLGTLGIITALYYQMMGCEVTAFETFGNRARLAERMGVRKVISCPLDEQVRTYLSSIDTDGADIAVDCSGYSGCILNAIEMTGKYGQVVLLGSPREEYDANVSVPFYTIHSKMLTVIGALNRRFNNAPVAGTRINMNRSMADLEKMMIDGRLHLSTLISHEIEPDEKQLLEAYRGLMYDRDNYTGVIIDWKK